MTALEQQRRPGGGPGAARSAVAARKAQSSRARHDLHQTPAPVDGGLAMLHGPLMDPDSPPAIWREYGKPPAAPWGSYLDTSPLPVHSDGRGPITVMHDMIEQHRAGVRR